MASPQLAGGEEKTSEGVLLDSNNNAVLSWTNSEQEFGQQNFIRYEPDTEVVQLNATDNWNALVLYLRKEDIVATGAGGDKQLGPPSVHARTFVYGRQNTTGDAKWRKVPLQIVVPGSSPVFAKSPVAASSAMSAANEETKHQETTFFGGNQNDLCETIPNLLSFGEGANDPVKPLLLWNDLQQANQNMKNLQGQSQQQQPKGETKQHIASAEPQIRLDTKDDDELTSNASTQLSLTKTQTIKALSYLRKVTEMRKNKNKHRMRNAQSKTNHTAALDRFDEHDEIIKSSNNNKVLEHESIEVASNKKQRSFEDHQTELLEHACGLREFCNPRPNVDDNDADQEISFGKPNDDDDSDDEDAVFDDDDDYDDDDDDDDDDDSPPQKSAPVLQIHMANSEFQESVLTAPTMSSPKKQHPPFPEQQRQRDNMRTVMLKLLKRKKRKQHTSSVSNTTANTSNTKAEETETEQAAGTHSHQQHRAFGDFEEENEESPLGKSSSSSFVEAKLAEMGYTKISEVEERTEAPEHNPKEEKHAMDSSSKASTTSMKTTAEITNHAKSPLLLQPETKTDKETDLDALIATSLGMDSDFGVAAANPLLEIEKQLTIATEKLANIQRGEEENGVQVSQKDEDEEDRDYANVAAIEVNYLPRKRGQRGRFRKRSQKHPGLQTAPTSESMIRIEANAENSKEAGPTSLVAIVRSDRRKTLSGYLPKRRGRKKVLARPSASFNGLIRSGATKGANSVATKSIAGNSIANEFGISSVATASFIANETGIVETQDIPGDFSPLLSFDESKVRERVASYQDEDVQDEATLEKMHGTRKKGSRGLGALFAMTSSKAKEPVPLKEEMLVEVCDEASDGGYMEKIEVDSMDEENNTTKMKTATGSRIVKALSLSKVKSFISPNTGVALDDAASSLSQGRDNLSEHLSQPRHEGKGPAFLSKRPAGIDTTCHMSSYEVVPNTSGLSKTSCVSMASEHGTVKIDHDEDNSAVEASLDMDTVQANIEERSPPPTMCCAAHASPVKKRYPSWTQNNSPSASQVSENSAMSKLQDPLPRNRMAAGAVSPNTMFSDNGTAVSVETRSSQTFDNATLEGGIGANCVFFDTFSRDANRYDDEDISIGTSTSQGNSYIIEVARKRIEADEAQEKAFQAAEYAAEAARVAAAKFQEAKERSTEYNARRNKQIGSFLLAGRGLSPRSNVDPPAAKASVQMYESNTHLLPPPPPPPPSPSQRRKRSSSPRRKRRTSPTSSQGAVQTTAIQTILDELELENLRPPPPPPRRQQSQCSKAPLPPPEQEASSAPSITPVGSSEGRFGWIKSMLPKSQKLFPSSSSSHSSVIQNNSTQKHKQQTHRPLLGEDQVLSFRSTMYAAANEDSTTGASADGSHEVIVAPDTYLI